MATSAQYKLGEYAFPRGWFAVADSAQVKREPFNVHYFGQEMVLYRGESGKVVMLDAYCPHYGTHMGKSKNSATVLDGTFLEGDSIRCPFHGWRFGPDGKCDEIPYSEAPIPEAAQVKSWLVEERWGIVFCWHDPEGGEPNFKLPELPEWDDPQFVRWQGLDHVGDLMHPIEVFDNYSDAPHFKPLHGSGTVLAYENEVDGPLYRQRNTMSEGYSSTEEKMKLLGTRPDSRSESQAGSVSKAVKAITTIGAYFGTGLMLARFVKNTGVQLLCTTPIDDGTCRVMSAAMLKSPSGNADPAIDEKIRSGFARVVVDGLRRDGEIWVTKKAALTIMQIPADGPLGQARKWYSQFYNPRAKAGEILKDITGKHYVRGIPPWSESEFAEEDRTK